MCIAKCSEYLVLALSLCCILQKVLKLNPSAVSCKMFRRSSSCHFPSVVHCVLYVQCSKHLSQSMASYFCVPHEESPIVSYHYLVLIENYIFYKQISQVP